LRALNGESAVTDQADLYDLTSVKYHESFRNPEVAVRLVMLGSCALILALWYAQPPLVMAGWFTWYVVNLLAVFALVRLMPQQLDRRGKLRLIAIFSLDVSAYALLPLWLWWQDNWDLRSFAYFLLFAGMLHGVAFRSMTQLRRVTNAVYVAIGMILILIMWFFQAPTIKHFLAMALGMGALYLYFIFAVYQSLVNQRRVREVMTRRINNERIAAVGELTGGVAHDFNNLLTVILGNIELAQHTKDAAERQLLLDEAFAAGERGARLTSQLLSFSRKSVLEPEVVDLAALLERNLDFLRRVLPSRIAIELLPPAQALPLVSVDVAKFETMLLNLVLNARDAIAAEGTIRIRSGLSADRRSVSMSVDDTGAGIPKDVLRRVTEPFFTTKPVGKGTGLGLSMAKGFVEQSKGTLQIASTVGQGTQITVTLPVATAAEQDRLGTKLAAPSPKQPAPRGPPVENF
jgi:signal transduction histidine kinase